MLTESCFIFWLPSSAPTHTPWLLSFIRFCVYWFILFLWNIDWGYYGPGALLGTKISRSIRHGPWSLRFTTYQERETLRTNPSQCERVTFAERGPRAPAVGKKPWREWSGPPSMETGQICWAERTSRRSKGRLVRRPRRSRNTPLELQPNAPDDDCKSFWKTRLWACFPVSKALEHHRGIQMNGTSQKRPSPPLSSRLEILLAEMGLNTVRFCLFILHTPWIFLFSSSSY